MNDITFHFNPITGDRLRNPIPVRVLESQIVYRKEEVLRPIGVKDKEGNSLTEIQNCQNSQWYWNFEQDGFKGKLKRTTMCLDGWML